MRKTGLSPYRKLMATTISGFELSGVDPSTVYQHGGYRPNGGGMGLTDLDLDFETTLASLGSTSWHSSRGVFNREALDLSASFGTDPNEALRRMEMGPPAVAEPASRKGVPKKEDATTEKRLKRRESHNLVERRRRDHINGRITELATLLPALLEVDDALPEPPLTLGSAGIESMGLSPAQATAAASGKPNKGIILSKSVDYIRYLKQMVDVLHERNRHLEEEAARSSPTATRVPTRARTPRVKRDESEERDRGGWEDMREDSILEEDFEMDA